MAHPTEQHLFEVLLDSWDRNNTILLNLLRAIPEGGLEIRAMEGSPTVAESFTHMHYVRLVFVAEDTPEFAFPVPAEEWVAEGDRERIAEMLKVSAAVVRRAVQKAVEAGMEMQVHYDHPILLLQHLIWHEGYHHGQIKLALKMAGRALPDDAVGPGTWGVWMDKTAARVQGTGDGHADSAETRLAIYGSLAPGQVNHYQLAALEGKWRRGTVQGKRIEAGWGATLGFPGLILDPSGPVVEVYLFESAELPGHWARLDEFEGAGYRRVVTLVRTEEGEVPAYVYVIAG